MFASYVQGVCVWVCVRVYVYVCIVYVDSLLWCSLLGGGVSTIHDSADVSRTGYMTRHTASPQQSEVARYAAQAMRLIDSTYVTGALEHCGEERRGRWEERGKCVGED